jgi:hypothetical protein
MARPGRSTNRSSDPQELAQAVKQIRDWHKLGTRSLKARAWNARRAEGYVADEARELGTSAAYLTKLRKFADPQKGYTEKQLERFCDQCRGSGRAPGISAILLLVTVPERRVREKLQRRMLDEDWGLKQLITEIRVIHGRRRSGGRPPRVASNQRGILAQTDDLIETWLRWEKALSAPSVKEKLPPEVLKGIEEVAKTARALRESIGSADRGSSSEANPGRHPTVTRVGPKKKR